MRLAGDYHLEVLENVEFSGPLLTEWHHLWEAIPVALTFQRPEWILIWIQSFSPRQPFLVTVRYKEKLVAIAPCLFYERYANGKSPERVLGLMGGGTSDYLDILFDPLHAQNIMPLIWKRLGAENNHCDVIEFTDLPANSFLCRNLGGPFPIKDKKSRELESHKHDCCSFLAIPHGIQELKDIIPAHKWENIRNASNRLEKAGGGSVEIADENTLDAALEDLFRLHRARWAQKSLPGVLNEHTVREFHRNIAPALLSKNVLRLYSLRLNGICIGSAYIFFEREQVLCYLHGYDPQYAHLSPGTLVLAAAMEDAIRMKKKTINFLRGREEYKKSWGVLEENTFCVRLKLSDCVVENTFAA